MSAHAESRTTPDRTTHAGPSTAESVRTTCLRADHAVLAVCDDSPVATTFHMLRAPGEMILAVPAAVNVADSPVPAVLEITDQAPINLRERVRSLVWISGELRAVRRSSVRPLLATLAAERAHAGMLDVGHTATLMSLTIGSIVVADASGAESVLAADLFAADPDPFWEVEPAWLAHLDADHSDMVEAIARRLPRALRQGVPRPLGIDRWGIRLRIEGAGADTDVRVPFPAPVSDVTELSRALRILVGCPFLNGLRATR